MNANELADILAKSSIRKVSQGEVVVDIFEIAAVLRQQQAEIEALKNELKRYAEALGEERGNKALKNHEIAEILTKVLNDCGLLKKENP
jgi:hypothetical protein